MANELRKRADFVAGGLTTGLTATDTAMASPGLIDLPPIGSTEFAALALFRTDTTGRVIKKEIVWVLDHVVGTSAATIVRAREGTTPQIWDIGDRWSHTQTGRDITVICTAGTRPVNPHVGLEIYEYDTTSKRVWDGTAWQQIGGIPVGTIIWRPKVAAVPGYMRCDGALYDRTTYADLYAYLGFDASPVPGTDPGSNQFYVPNTKGKAFVDLDAAQTEFDTALKSGGSKTSTAPHTHGLSAHTHSYSHTHGMNTVDTNHAHNVYSRNTDHVHNFDHWHLASIGATMWNGTQTHGHHDRGGVASEGPWEGANWTGGAPVNVTGTGAGGTGGMSANASHDHPSTNYASESPWAGNYTHAHTTNSQSASTSSTPSNDTSGASSAAATSGNLQPYTTMVAYIKF